ncbi:MAG: DUF998 domain-containing protein [Promethearchaeota archaeon]
MKKITKSIDKILEIIPGGIFGLLSVAIIVLGELIAFLLFPGYSFFKNMVSELGAGPGAIFFNLSVLISGIIIIPYYLQLAKCFSGEKVKEHLRKFAFLVAIISCITYSLLGVFPSVKSDTIIYLTHGILAAVSIASGLGYLLLYSILMLRAQNFSKYQAYHGFIVAILYATFLLIWIPIVEWVMNLAILSWITTNSLYILYLTRKNKLILYTKFVNNEEIR